MESLPIPSPKIEATNSSTDNDVSLLVTGLTEGGRLSATAAELNQNQDWISRLITNEHISSKRGEISLVASPNADGPALLLFVGLGQEDELNEADAFQSCSAAIRHLAKKPYERVVIDLAGFFEPSLHESMVAGAIFGCEGQGIYQSEPPIHVPGTIAFVDVASDALDSYAMWFLGDCHVSFFFLPPFKCYKSCAVLTCGIADPIQETIHPSLWYRYPLLLDDTHYHSLTREKTASGCPSMSSLLAICRNLPRSVCLPSWRCCSSGE